jgi:hypothetical protein
MRHHGNLFFKSKQEGGVMRSFFASLVLVVAIIAAGNSWVDENPAAPSGAIVTPGLSSRAPWDLQFSFDLELASGALGNSGAEFDGTYYYSTRWASNLIHQYDQTGTLVKEFSIPGVSGLRDLAWDGEYMYGGAAGGTIWQMDFMNETLEGTITGGFQSRAIAYHEGNDTFICSNWGDPVWEVDRTGAIVGTFNLVTTTSTYGFAYDNMCGDNFLWVFDQGMGSGLPQYIHQWDLDLGSYTGTTYDVAADFPASSGIAGGLWMTSDLVAGTVTIGGCLQGTPDMMFAYELCDNPIQDTITPFNGTNFNPGDTIEYQIQVSNTATWGIPIVGWVEAGSPVPPRFSLLFGPVGGTLPGGATFTLDRDVDLPGATPPWTFPICLIAEGAVDCYDVTVNP